MSYKALARKWRPKNLDQVVGQTHVTQTLRHCLEQKRLHHAYLFSGIRGTGKTSIARILTKCFNCQTGITSRPCEVCDVCLSINQSSCTDLIEIDAASKTKVEQTREIIENAAYMPQQGRHKVYLIDEVHMLSNASFNALLKTLEEPPDHVKFILATTHPQKIPPTILSRCLQFNLKRLNVSEIKSQLTYILEDEKIDAEDQALEQLALAADGSLRDALSLLDQTIAYCNEKSITFDQIKKILGIASEQVIEKIIRSLESSDAISLFNITTDLYENGQDFIQVINHTIEILHDLRLAQIESNFLATSHQWKKNSHTISAEKLESFYHIALNGKKEIALAPTPKIGLDMLFLRMLRAVENQKSKIIPSTPIPKKIEKIQDPIQPVQPDQPSDQNQQTTKKTPSLPVQKKIPNAPKQSTQTANSSTHIENNLKINQTLLEKWQAFIKENENKLTGALKLLANNMCPKRWDENLTLLIDQQYASILTKKMKALFIESIRTLMPNLKTIDILLSEQNIQTPFGTEKQNKIKEKIQVEQTVKNDPDIQEIVQSLDGKIIEIEIKKEENNV